jgi:HprK-related kinase A
LIVSELSGDSIQLRLRAEGLYIQTGPFANCIKSKVQSVADGIHLLYADHTVLDASSFADFHVCITPQTGLRRWYRPQAIFKFDEVETFAPLPLEHAYPMLEWGLNWCVSTHAHGFLTIHAAVVEKNGVALMMPAPPGSGKSTLCAALVCQGWRLLSDELCMIRLEDQFVVPLPRPVSLKNQSIDVIQAFESSAVLSRRVSDTIKGTVAHMKPPQESVRRAAEPGKLAYIVFPRYVAGANTCLEPIASSRAFMRVADNAFNYSVHGRRGFEVLTSVVADCHCYDFSYSRLDEAIQLFSELSSHSTFHDH